MMPSDTPKSSSGLRGSYFRSAMGITLVVAAFILLVVGVFAVDIFSGLPDLEELENPRPDLSTRIYSADGQQLDQFFVHNRTYITFDSIPPNFIHALIATEDQKFYDHWGVNLERIIKALVKNVLSMNLTKEGASTITQQLARNLYLSQEVSMTRKLREQLTAVQIERTYTKDEILEMYANTVYFGRGAYGLQVAAEIYFGKRPIDLTLDECAYLVGVLKGPENYDIEQHYDRAIDRRNTVLALMQEMGYITTGEYGKFAGMPIKLAKRKRVANVAGHFVEAVRQILSKEPKLEGYNLYRDGLVIYTTIDSRMQKYANQAVREHLEGFQRQFESGWSWRGRERLLKQIVERAARNTEEYKAAINDEHRAKILKALASRPDFIDSVKKEAIQIETGFVVMEARTGYVRALVGGRAPSTGMGLNHVTQIRRQPGSSFKPFVYASALEEGMNPGSGVSAGTFVYRMPGGETWQVLGTGGALTLRSALKFSVNSVAARLICERTTPAKVVRLAKNMGIKSPIPDLPSIALGSAEVTPLELTAAYTAFPNDGVAVEPILVTKIEDRWGRVIYQAPRVLHEALPAKIAGQMVSMMRGVVDGGTASSIRQWFNYPAAGKTGTTNDFADAWFVGYTPELVAGVWVGFDDHRIKFTGWYGQGGKAAAPVWGRFMAMVYKDDRLPYDVREFSGAAKGAAGGGTLTPGDAPIENTAPPTDVLGTDATDGTEDPATQVDGPNEKPDAPPQGDIDKDKALSPQNDKDFGGDKPK